MFQQQTNRRQSSDRPQEAETLSQTQKEVRTALIKTSSSDLGTNRDEALELIKVLVKERLKDVPKKDVPKRDIYASADDLHANVQNLDVGSPEFEKAMKGFRGQVTGEVLVSHPKKKEIEVMLKTLNTLIDPEGDFVKSLPAKDRETIRWNAAMSVYLKIGGMLGDRPPKTDNQD